MRRLRRRISHLYHSAKHPFDRLWHWAKGHARRWKALSQWARDKRLAARAKHRLKVAQGWAKRHTVYRRRYKRAKKRAEQTGQASFEPWMLNGCPDTLRSDLKPVVAYMVVECGQYVTATSNGTHTPSSLHYPWNNVDHKCDAFDSGAGSVSSMQAAQTNTVNKFGQSFFTEFFGPCGWYIKYGTRYSGYFPGHGNHNHAGRR